MFELELIRTMVHATRPESTDACDPLTMPDGASRVVSQALVNWHRAQIASGGTSRVIDSSDEWTVRANRG